MSPQSKRSQFSFVWVLLANLLSLAVIWWGGWQAHALLVVYWLETGIIVAVYTLKITRAEGNDDPETIQSWTSFDGEPAEWYLGKDSRTVADALVLSFAGPWVGWGMVILMFGFTDVFEFADLKTVVLATGAFLSYHVASYWYEYLWLREYEHRGPVSLLVEPAPHVWALLFAVLFGGGVSAFFESPAGLIVGLVFFKTCADLVAHRRERKRALA